VLGAMVSVLEKGESIDKAIVLANIASGIAVCRYGAQPSMPAWEEVEKEYME